MKTGRTETATGATAPLIILAAGEASGDRLGAGLIRAMRQQRPDLQFTGIGGPAMAAAGMHCWHDIAELSVMGLAEVLRHLPRLLRLQRRFRQRVLQQRPLAFIGIDAPDFNLPLEHHFKQAGITTLHYVSPSVWAWRPQRVRHVAAACHRLLCLFPFEPQYYAGCGLDCVVTGHPRADEIALDDNRTAARQTLGLSASQRVIALLPGSRNSERKRLIPVFLAAARQFLHDQSNHGQSNHGQSDHGQETVFLSAQPDQHGREQLQNLQHQLDPDLPLRLVDDIDTVLSACDGVLAASGTVTLEALLHHRPMVAAYRLHGLTYQWVKHFKLMRSPWLTLPNALAQEMLVPEIFQHDATPQRLATALAAWWEQPARLAHYRQRARDIHTQLRLRAHQRAAQAVLDCLQD